MNKPGITLLYIYLGAPAVEQLMGELNQVLNNSALYLKLVLLLAHTIRLAPKGNALTAKYRSHSGT